MRFPYHPGVLADSGASIAMPTGEPADIDYDSKKGLSIGCVGTDAGCSDSHNSPSTPAPSSPTAPNRASTAEEDAALRQAAQQCKQRQQEAYERLRQKRRNRIEDLRRKIPELEACIQGRRAVPASNERLVELREQRDTWLARANRMLNEAAKLNGARKWDEAIEKATKLEQEIQQVKCAVDLDLIRNELANAGKAMDELDREIEAHRRERFREIDSLMLSGKLEALRHCTEQGYLKLDDLMQELFK